MRRFASVMLALGAGAFGATAMAQAPAVDQYSTPTTGTVSGSGSVTVTTPTTGTTPTGTTDGSGTAPGNAGGGDATPGTGNGSGSGTTPGGDSGTSTSAGTTLAGGAVAPADRAALIQFGAAPKALRGDIVVALRQAGLQVIFNGGSTKPRMRAFLASPMARLLSTGDAEAVGRAFGAQLVNVTPVARRAFPLLFGTDVPFVPVIRAVLTRRDSLTDRQVAFQKGVTKGLLSTDIPLAYVERSDRRTPSLVKEYRKLGVLTVDDIDTATGKRRLGQIMLGQITTQKAVDAVTVKPASQRTGTNGSSAGTTPWIILVALGGAAAFFMTGTLRRRGRGTA